MIHVESYKQFFDRLSPKMFKIHNLTDISKYHLAAK